GPTMLAHPLKIKSTEAWGENLWRITVIGQTPPGREWLIDRYFIEALETIDDGKAAEERLFPLKPIVRYADPKADSRFRRAIRIKRDEQQWALVLDGRVATITRILHGVQSHDASTFCKSASFLDRG